MATYYKTAEDFDWYKFFPASFAMTTAHLSHVELGVYRRILDRYWVSDNTIPRDLADIAERIGEKVFNWRRYGITAPAGFENEEITIKVVEHLLSEFFDQDEDGDWRHVWLDDYRKATDTQFKARSEASKQRVARQGRGPKGQFGKIVSPCLTDENTVPHGDPPSSTVDAAVEQSREDENKADETKVDKNTTEESKEEKLGDVASSLPQEPSVPKETPFGDSPEKAFRQESHSNPAPPEHGPNWEASY